MMDRTWKILIADDEVGITRLVSAYLKRDNFRVFIANNGMEAYDLFVKYKPDLLVLDIMMPELDGLELVELIRKKSRVPVIFLTAKTDEADRIKGFKYGVDDYVSKPFSPRELVERVKAVLRRSSPEIDDTVIEYGPLTLHLRDRQLFLQDHEISLTGAQFDILYKLISSPGQVFSRDQLNTNHDKQDSSSGNRSVDVQIKNIRKAISEAGGYSDLIKTHHGIGYSIRKDPK
jgi:two-component system OmpR family response regulator